MAKKKQVRINTIGELYDQLGTIIDDNSRELPIHISVPFRNGIGLHYECLVNVTTHSGIVDIHSTTPLSDDIKKPQH